MQTVYILTGGNLGNREKYLTSAIKLINQYCGNVIKKSSLYETAAWGITTQPLFLNQVLQVETELLPTILMQQLLSIEEAIGRKRVEKYGPRIIDLDILLMNDYIIKTELLHIPHKELHNRRFALTPLQEIAPDLVHPILKKSIKQLLQECKDELDVQKYSVDT